MVCRRVRLRGELLCRIRGGHQRRSRMRGARHRMGIAAQIKRGHFALSELGRHGMLSKLALYASVIVGFILIERMAGVESHIAVVTVCTLICLVELWSMGGSALIVNPKMRFLRIFREVLAGEVARKMQVPVEEAKKYLDGTNKQNQHDTRS